MRIAIEAFGDDQLDRELLRFKGRGDDLRPAFLEIEKDFYEMEERQFASEGRHASSGWAPLTPGYAAWKARRFPGRKILELTGAMRAALTKPNAPNRIRKLSPDEFHLLVTLDYPRYHQKGTHKMARRRVVELRPADRVRFVKIIQLYLRTGQVRGGLGL